MGYVVQRFGFRLTRGWAVLLLALGSVVALAFWIGPIGPPPAELQVLAFARTPTDGQAVVVPARDTATGRLRFAIPLTIRNVGERATYPERLMLSVPAYYQLATRDGPLSGDVTPGVPLRRYAIDLEPATIPPDSLLRTLAGVDTIWVEPDLPSYYCIAASGPIPDFVPAPARDPGIISDLRIFYSVRTRRSDERHAGLLSVRVDPAALKVDPAPLPPAFPTTFRTPEVEEPPLVGLRQVGTRRAHCGDPEQPMELRTVLLETATRGRVYEVHVQDAPRKRLYDLNRDSIIELETWDMDGDGRFDARREARFRVPDFLVPPPSRVPYALLPDSVPPDSIWLAMFHDTGRGLHRFTQPLPRPVAALTEPGAAQGDSTGPATEESPELRERGLDAGARIAVTAGDTATGRPPAAWVALFNDTNAGPFRFTNPAAAASAVSRAAADSVADSTKQVRERVRRRPRHRLLGTPIAYPRRPGRR
jgi:hypothetical protein